MNPSILTRRRICLLLSTVPLALANPICAQTRESALSDAEVEKLRDTAYVPPVRILTFIGFLDDRTRAIQTLANGPRKAGRDQDLHDLMEQVTSVADDLEDNLDDYGPRHRDLRKVLPKLIAASERWATILRTPAENETYGIARKLALEAIRDIREDATRLVEEQRVWFAAHPPDESSAEPGGRSR